MNARRREPNDEELHERLRSLLRTDTALEHETADETSIQRELRRLTAEAEPTSSEAASGPETGSLVQSGQLEARLTVGQSRPAVPAPDLRQARKGKESTQKGITRSTRPKASRREPTREVFLEQLNDFYATCGRPHYKEIAEISERLDDLYPLEGDRKRDLPTLSPSGISEVLAGRRKNLPSAGWLAAFVLSCQRRATELGSFDADPGVSTLPVWQRKLTEAQSKLPHN